MRLRWRSGQGKRLSTLRLWVRFFRCTLMKRVSQRIAESRGFSPGAPVSSHRGLHFDLVLGLTHVFLAFLYFL